jgi:prepilin-type N-terminal cleavage/methylation domain-containing protein
MKSSGFSLLELLVAMAVTALLVVLLATAANSTGLIWQRGESQVMSYSNARGAMDLLGRDLQSTIIDLDIGFRIDSVTGEPNNFVIRLLRRRKPENGKTAIEKVAYQLAWAGSNLVPTVQPTWDAAHPVPVLIRTVNASDLADVFEVASAAEVDRWSREWGNLTATVPTGTPQPNGDIVEIVADHVLGWRVLPVHWDTTLGGPAFDSVDQSKFFSHYLTSDHAPNGIAVEMLVTSPRIANRLQTEPEWAQVRRDDALFRFPDLPESVFYRQLLQHIRRFDSTYYLFSRTP